MRADWAKFKAEERRFEEMWSIGSKEEAVSAGRAGRQQFRLEKEGAGRG